MPYRDFSDFEGYLALPDATRAPGVLVLHAWWGLTPFFQGFCDRLAAEGYAVLAPDLYHGETANTIDAAKQLRAQLDRKQADAEINAALDYLKDTHRFTRGMSLGVIGFSLGGYWAFALATERPTDLQAAVIFYGLKKADFRKTQTAFLGHYAEQDPWAELDDVHDVETRLLAAGKDATFHVYPGTTHWFFEKDQRDAYHSKAAQLAWKRTVAFLKQTLRTE